MFIDPICRMEIEDSTFYVSFKEKKHYFCSKGCLVKFKNKNNFVNHHTYDLVIIGGGPAGLTAAVYASILKIDTYFITKNIGGQAIDSNKIKNYMGYDFISGKSLIDKFQNQFLHSNYLDHKIDEVLHIKCIKSQDFYITTKSKDTLHTRAIIIATGMKQRKLGIPGEDEFQRRGVFYNSVQDISLLAGKKVSVIGGGNSGVQTALKLNSLGCEVSLITKGNLIADSKDITQLKMHDEIRIIEHHDIVRISGKETLEKMIIQSELTSKTSHIPCEAVFIQVGFLPNTEFCSNLVTLNEKGEIKIDYDCSTNIKGIFACGDVTNAYGKRIVIATGEGAKAALRVKELLIDDPTQIS